jgi:peroxiredoxin
MTSATVAQALDAKLDELLAADAPLAERLGAYAAYLRDINSPFAEAVDRLVARLQAVGAGATVPQLGEAMPPFLLPDEAGHLVALDRLIGGGPLVVAFRRGHWCPYCQLATDALARVEPLIRAEGGGVVVITPEREVFTARLKHRSHAGFPILSDMDNGYALSVGLAISVGEEMRDLMSKRGRDLATYQGNDAWLLPIPATFVLDRDGIVRWRHVDADYRRRAAVEDLLAAVRAMPAQIP